MVKSMLLSLSGFIIGFVVYDKFDSGIEQLVAADKLSKENEFLKHKLVQGE